MRACQITAESAPTRIRSAAARTVARPGVSGTCRTDGESRKSQERQRDVGIPNENSSRWRISVANVLCADRQTTLNSTTSTLIQSETASQRCSVTPRSIWLPSSKSASCFATTAIGTRLERTAVLVGRRCRRFMEPFACTGAVAGAISARRQCLTRTAGTTWLASHVTPNSRLVFT